MEKVYLDTLKQRKSELLTELDHINSILQIYPEEYNPSKADTTKSVVSNTKHSNLTVKQRIIEIINGLGGKAYVSQVVKELKKQYPERDIKAINNQARNYVHMLKKDGYLKPELKGHNKYLYHVVEK